MRVIRHLSILALLFSTSLSIMADTAKYSDSAGGINVNSTVPLAYSFDTTEFSTPDILLNNNTQVTVTNAGLYQVTYALNWETNDNSRRQIKSYLLQNGIDIVPGSFAYGYARRIDQAGSATNTATVLVDLQAGEFLELVHVNNSTMTGLAYSIPGENGIQIHRVGNSLVQLPTSCLDILNQNPAATDGLYQIDPDGSGTLAPLEVFCDMTFDGGGWTLVGSVGDTQATAIDTPVFLNSNTYLVDSIYQSLLSQASIGVRFSFNEDILVSNENLGGHSCHNLNSANGLAGNMVSSHTAISWAHNETNGCGVTGGDYSLVILQPTADQHHNVGAYSYSGNYFLHYQSGSWVTLTSYVSEQNILLSQDLYIYIR